MKALILAAGYAVRLYPLTDSQPKPLLKVAGRPILNYILEKIAEVDPIEEVIIVTNNRFYPQFQEWLSAYSYVKKIKLLNDGTNSNEDRRGAVGDIHFALGQENITTPLLVIAGDNLFGFNLQDFVNFFHQKNRTIVAFHDLKDKEKIKGRYGAAVLNHSLVLEFEEKPLQPRSTLAATACYLFHQQDLPLVEQSLIQGKADNPGELIRFLLQHSEVHGFVFEEPWFDVGSFESLKEAEEVYGT